MKYEILGETLPVVVCHLEAGERIFAEAGSMAWMSPNMRMETTTNGGAGKAAGRMFSGETAFLNVFTAEDAPGMIAFASSYIGEIRAFELKPGEELILQKHAFLACEEGIERTAFVHKKASTGLFGGEGIVMQKISGQGLAFTEFDGRLVEFDLAEGQEIVVSTGHLAAMTASCTMEAKAVSGPKNAILGGEGLFLTHITGPGHVWLQTMLAPKAASASSVSTSAGQTSAPSANTGA